MAAASIIFFLRSNITLFRMTLYIIAQMLPADGSAAFPFGAPPTRDERNWRKLG
jgi:hypothetical protein